MFVVHVTDHFLKSSSAISLDPIICFTFSFIARIWFFPWFSIAFFCFWKHFLKGEYIILLALLFVFLLKGNTSSPVRYSYLLILLYDKAEIFAASLLISYCSVSSLIWSPIVMMLLYIYCKIFFLKFKG